MPVPNAGDESPVVVQDHGDGHDFWAEPPFIGQQGGQLDDTQGVEKIQGQRNIPVFITERLHGFYNIIPTHPDRFNGSRFFQRIPSSLIQH